VVRGVMVAAFLGVDRWLYWGCSEPDQPDQKVRKMAKSLDAEMAAIEAEELKLAERRKAHQKKLRDTAIDKVEKVGLLKLPLDRLERLMEAVKTLGMDEVEKRITAKA
jgi:hypothetical protein